MSRPPLDDFRRELGKAAHGKTEAELRSLQEQVEWFARFAIEQALAARAARPDSQLEKTA